MNNTSRRQLSLELWEKMSEIGRLGLLIPEQYGGVGGGFFDLVVLLEEMGQACLPGSFFSSVVSGGLTFLEAGSDEQKQELLPKLAQGKLLLTLAWQKTLWRLVGKGSPVIRPGMSILLAISPPFSPHFKKTWKTMNT